MVREGLSDPIMLAGSTASGTLFVQFWGEVKLAGQIVQLCMAEMNLGKEFSPRMLMIAQECPPAWIDDVLAIFDRFRAGDQIEPTHTVRWDFGKPTFHAVGVNPT